MVKKLITGLAISVGAGIAITFISMRPSLLMFETPLIGLVCFAVILANWFGGVRYFQGVPGGLIAIAAGTAIAWGSNLFGLGYGGLSLGTLGEAVSHFGFSFPVPAVDHVFSGFKFLGVILITAIPFGIYDLVERYVKRIVHKFPSLAQKRVSPHSIRHTTATHLLRSGVDINTIRAWLGHVSLATTNIYAEIDLEMKAKALAHCEVKNTKRAEKWRENVGLMTFLRSL